MIGSRRRLVRRQEKVYSMRIVLIALALLAPLGVGGCTKCGFENPFKACSADKAT